MTYSSTHYQHLNLDIILDLSQNIQPISIVKIIILFDINNHGLKNGWQTIASVLTEEVIEDCKPIQQTPKTMS